MKIISEFLPEELITDIRNYAISKVGSFEWKSNLSWSNGVVENSNLILNLPLNRDKKIYESLKEKFCLLDDSLVSEHFHFIYTIFSPGSYIPWHDDFRKRFASTIYLNKKWDSTNGGILLYKKVNNNQAFKEEGEIFGISPKYNQVVINDKKYYHHVSMITPHAKEARVTIQVWIEINKNPENKFSYS